MFIIENLTVHTSEDKLKKSQFITVHHTSGHVKISTVYDWDQLDKRVRQR
jgi:hypothetical protein